MKKYKKNKRVQVTIIVIAALILLGIGYAALTTVLKINSAIGVGKVSFAIHFDNVGTKTHKATVNTEAHIIDEAKKEIEFDVYIERLDDYYAFTTDIVNEGSIPGKVKSIELQGLTESQRRLINYEVKYTTSNKVMAVGDYFGPYSAKNVTVTVTYQLAEDVEDEDLPQDDLNLNCIFVINFENGSLAELRSRAASTKLMQDTNYMNSSAVNFGSPVSSSGYEGAYILNGTENDDFPIYFYRGGHVKTKNNVLFGGYCWRIIRTTNTGGIKLLYAGLPSDDDKCPRRSGEDTLIGSSVYGSSSNYTGSTASQRAYAWYFERLINYQAYLEDTEFCNSTGYSNGDISLACDDSNKISVANGRNTYPIGLISAQEATLCGSTTGGGDYGFIYGGEEYWTMTAKNSGYIYPIYLWGNFYTDGWVSVGSFVSRVTYGLRPVISLNSDTQLIDGDGSMENPYKVELS